jgi:hypothetical protein
MKKFFVALLVLALAASNVFAEVSYSFEVSGKWSVVQGENGKRAHVSGTGIDVEEYKHQLEPGTSFKVTAANEDNTWGAVLNVLERANSWVWWQPISFVKTTFGKIDGYKPFGLPDDHAPFAQAYGFKKFFKGITSTEHAGVALQLFPIDILEVGVGIPVFIKDDDASGYPINDYSSVAAYAKVTLANIGIIGLEYAGRKDEKVSDPDWDKIKSAQIALGFQLTALDNLSATIGGYYPLPPPVEAEKVTVQEPIGIGLAANFKPMDAFSLAVHLKTLFGGNVKYDGDTEAEKGFEFGLTITPSYALDIGTFGIGLEFALVGSDKELDGGGTLTETKNDMVKFAFSPYFKKAYGGGTLTAGATFALENYTVGDLGDSDGIGLLKWSIPVKLVYAF